jgi:hypothetical protein
MHACTQPQEARQHFRRAFSYLDTKSDGRVTLTEFRNALTRLRYAISDGATRMLFDQIQLSSEGMYNDSGHTYKGYITAGDLAAPLINGRGGPKAWLRHSRLVAFDTSRESQRKLMAVRHMHERGNSVHDGIQVRCVCMCVCVYIYIYACVYIHTYI